MASRVRITLACSVCGNRNYRTTRSAKADARGLALKKFCSACKQHTLHQETK